MADKMMRIAGRTVDGKAESLNIDREGNLKTPKPAYKKIDIDFGSIESGETKREVVRTRVEATYKDLSWNVKHIVLDVPTNQDGTVMFTWRLGADSSFDEIMRLEGEQLRMTPHGITRGEIVRPNEFSPTKGVQLQQYIQQIAYISNDATSYFDLTNNTTATISGVTCRLFVEEI